MSDKGRYHSHMVIQDIEGCPETGFREVREIGNEKSALRMEFDDFRSQARLSLQICFLVRSISGNAIQGVPR
jgi:hypothetical protein